MLQRLGGERMPGSASFFVRHRGGDPAASGGGAGLQPVRRTDLSSLPDPDGWVQPKPTGRCARLWPTGGLAVAPGPAARSVALDAEGLRADRAAERRGLLRGADDLFAARAVECAAR